MGQTGYEVYRQNISERIARAYSSASGTGVFSHSPDARAPGHFDPGMESVDWEALRRAIADMQRFSGLVGQAPPEPRTLRGRMGAVLIRLMRRALFWYTPQIQQFQSSAIRAQEQQTRALEGIAFALKEALERLERADAVRSAEIERLRGGDGSSDRIPKLEPSRFDEFYIRFEDEYRGPRETIKERLRVYLPDVEKALAGQERAAILDIGCGRGEWLELLRDQRWDPMGIDRNELMVRLCESKGLRVRTGDGIEYLKSLPDGCLELVTAFHVIEHLPLRTLFDLFAEAYRVLSPGGVAIFETPNPKNLHVSTRSFYLDPTHRNPIPSELACLVAQFHGFEQVNIRDLNPWPESHHVQSSESPDLAGRFNSLFYGPQDYGVLAWKTRCDSGGSLPQP